MDSREIATVQESFDKIPDKTKQKLTRVLYDRLFELRPELRKIFKKDIREQRKKMLKVMAYIIDNLHDAEVVGPCMKELAIRHVHYGVKQEDYKPFGEALIFAVSAALGNDFKNSTRNAWINTYQTLSQIMIDSAYK